MGTINAFTLTIGVTPLLIGALMSRWLRLKMPRRGRVAMGLSYLVWGGRWAVIWSEMWSDGSGRYAVENLVFIWGVWSTIGVGAALMIWAESTRRDRSHVATS